jgi:hypothetical protein
MIAHRVFYDRRDNYCTKCEHWRGACLRGHQLASPAGCPLKKFEPVEGADYAQDMPEQPAAPVGGGKCCGVSPVEEMKPVTWPEVLALFATSMVTWLLAGAPLVKSDVHATRHDTCKKCPTDRYKNFYCLDCKCICYIKTKLATEQCPRGYWGSS